MLIREKYLAKIRSFYHTESLIKIIYGMRRSGKSVILNQIKEKEEIKDLPKLQKQILQNAAKYVKVGGTLIYSTCTIQDDENIEVVESFLQSNKRFQLEKIENINIDLENEDKGYLKIYPNVHGMDGFFIAKLKRVR